MNGKDKVHVFLHWSSVNDDACQWKADSIHANATAQRECICSLLQAAYSGAREMKESQFLYA